MKKFISVILVLACALSVISLSACSKNGNEKEQSASFRYTFTDDLGNKIELKNKPENVAVLFSSYAEVWTLAGGKISITVGEAQERGFADDTVKLVDKSAGKAIDTESLVAYEPDFVICSADIPAQKKAAKLLNEQGIPCAAFKTESFDDYLNMLKICTDITGNSESYQKNGLDIQEKINSILEKVKGQKAEKILFIRAGSSEKYTKAKVAEDHFAANMLKDLGTVNIAESAPVLLDGLSTEEIVEQNPSYIFIASMGKEKAAKKYMNSVLETAPWKSLNAVKNDKCFYLPKDLFHYKPNARWAEAYLYLAKELYPNINFGE